MSRSYYRLKENEAFQMKDQPEWVAGLLQILINTKLTCKC